MAPVDFTVNRPRLTFVIRTKYTMVDAIQQVMESIFRLTGALQFDPTYLQNFGLVLFNDNRMLAFILSYL